MSIKVQTLQFKLSRAAKQKLDRKFGALYDKIYRRDVLTEAWKRVRANKGAPGIDEQDFEWIEAELGVGRFLGVHFKLCPVTKPDRKLKKVCRVWPSDRSMKRIREKIRKKVGRRYNMSLEEMIEELNPMLRGWHNYHKAVDPQKRRILKLNGYLWNRLRGFLRRKYNDDTRGCKRLRGGLLAKLGLYQFA